MQSSRPGRCSRKRPGLVVCARTRQAPERLSDKDVKALVDQVDEGRDKFEGNLDGKFKGSILWWPDI